MEPQANKPRWDDKILDSILERIPSGIEYDRDKVREKFQQCQTIDDLTGPNGFIREILKSTVERMTFPPDAYQQGVCASTRQDTGI